MIFRRHVQSNTKWNSDQSLFSKLISTLCTINDESYFPSMSWRSRMYLIQTTNIKAKREQLKISSFMKAIKFYEMKSLSSKIKPQLNYQLLWNNLVIDKVRLAFHYI